jgi:alkylation response protein AidB-like acyl-CoA dehydrogenase
MLNQLNQGKPSVEEFQAQAKAWIQANLPAEGSPEDIVMSSDDETLRVALCRKLQRQIFEGGFAGIMYPKDVGGLGLTRAHQHAFLEASSGYVLPNLFAVTHGILGPTLLDFATEEKQREYIPKMLSGEALWVQFLSEPSGGSDMAAARTRATRDGDTYIINGSKTWSTGAHFSDMALVLVRTDWDAPKHRGLSMIVVPIRTEGVQVRPIELADNSSDFAEEFFDDVVVPGANLVGIESDGWTVASRLLFHERSMVGGNSLNDNYTGSRRSGNPLEQSIALATKRSSTSDPLVRQLIGELRMQELVRPNAVRTIDKAIRSGVIPGPGASLLKLMSSKMEYRGHEIIASMATEDLIAQDLDTNGSLGRSWLVSRTSTVAGGTSEMQLNQISERVLGLPREPAPDKGLPFSQATKLGTERE